MYNILTVHGHVQTVQVLNHCQLLIQVMFQPFSIIEKFSLQILKIIHNEIIPK